jgi:hypothetical protein
MDEVWDSGAGFSDAGNLSLVEQPIAIQAAEI